jgi:signal transduction histidine kinase
MLADGRDLSTDSPQPALAGDIADALLVSGMRLVLALAVLLASLTDPASFSDSNHLVWLLFAAYLAHSLMLHALALLRQPVAMGKLTHWLDLAWYALFVALTGGSRSLLFLFFFFAILSASFRWGFEEGARVTVAAAVLLTATALFPGASADLPRLLLRSSFLLALGYISAYWGESKVALNRRLALLHDVSQWSNPRFGVDHTLTRVLQKTGAFFKARSCVLVLRDRETGMSQLRSVQTHPSGKTPSRVQAEAVSARVAEPLLALAPGQLALLKPERRIARRHNRLLTLPAGTTTWSVAPASALSQRLNDWLEGAAFISAPVSLRRSEGRLFVVTGKRASSKTDAVFLGQIVDQVFPMVENIELVDRMASQAASQERQKIALDIHDRAVQPYIGLTLGLSAVRHKAEPSNPLLEDIDKLSAVARQAIEDLRHYAGSFKRQTGAAEPVFAAALQQQVAQVRALYGIDIRVSAEPDLQVNDRLMAEVLQIVREGLSNICRHTLSQSGAVKLQRSLGWLRIQIENTQAIAATDNQPTAPVFSPRSITERVRALGGLVTVAMNARGDTSVQIEIPV